MLNMVKTQEMTDVVHSAFSYSGIEHAVISTPIYNRLHRILQSSLVYLTFPSNKVKRFEHSVGVMHISGMIFFNSICNSDDDVLRDFMDRISLEIKRWREDLDFNQYSFVSKELRNKYKALSAENELETILSAPVPRSQFYNRFQPANLDKENIFAYFVAFQSVRLAGLLHDVGHLPYSHILEHALNKMYVEIKEKESKSEVEKQFLETMKRFAEGEDEIHEEIGKLLVDNIRNSIIESISERTDPNIYFFLASFDFAQKIICSNFSDNTIFSELHLITSGVVDADRLDYCSRDAFCSGTNKSIFAYGRLLDTYKLIRVEEDGICRFYFSPSTKSLAVIEELLRRRKDIFTEINFHHRVHKHEILLEEIICTIGIEEIEEINELKPLSHTLPLRVSGIWQLISKLDSNSDWPEYQIIQLDDSWLDTLLKHSFFDKYGADYLSLREHGNDIVWNKFDELISATKRYHSFLKRTNDFIEFDKLFHARLQERSEELKKKFSGKDILYLTYNDFYEKYRSLAFNYCIDTVYITDGYKGKFFGNFETEVNALIKNKDLNINDCLLRSCMFSFGYKTAKTPLFLSDEEHDPVRVEQISSQLEIFQRERAIAPIFHLYYLPKYIVQYGVYAEVNKKDFLDTVVDAAVNTIAKI